MPKPFLIFILLFGFKFHTQAQIYKSLLVSSDFTEALQKIVTDYQNNYQGITGELLQDQGDMAVYQSTVQLPGAADCHIYKFKSVEDTSASWQATMYNGKDYNAALRTYLKVARQIKNSQFMWLDGTNAGFVGEVNKPAANVRFALSRLKFDVDSVAYQLFTTEVELAPSYDNWQVHLNLHAKTPDNQRPTNY